MKILIINGPNINVIHLRDPHNYGAISIDDINILLQKKFPQVTFEFFQTNHEGSIIDKLQEFSGDALIINPGAYTHTSIAIRDCLEYMSTIKVEVHLSDIHNREDFRKVNYISDVVNHTIVGKHSNGYIEAVEYILDIKK